MTKKYICLMVFIIIFSISGCNQTPDEFDSIERQEDYQQDDINEKRTLPLGSTESA